MFDQLFGRYLVASNRITQEQLTQIRKEQDQTHVRLGLIAVTEKYMTEEQTKEVHHLQSVMDKRFGDIAREKHYLTEEQLQMLLALQGNAYQAFIQLLIDLHMMSLSDIEDALKAFQTEYDFADEDMEQLKSCDVDQILSIYGKIDKLPHSELIGILVRTLIRTIDSKLAIGTISKVDSITADYCAFQKLSGDFDISLVFCGEEKNLLPIASVFAEEQFETVNADSLDSVCELINCINGLYATSLSYSKVEVNMDPPHYELTTNTFTGTAVYLIPIYMQDTEFQAAIVIKRF